MGFESFEEPKTEDEEEAIDSSFEESVEESHENVDFSDMGERIRFAVEEYENELNPEAKEKLEMVSEEADSLGGVMEKVSGLKKKVGIAVATGFFALTLMAAAPKKADAGASIFPRGKITMKDKSGISQDIFKIERKGGYWGIGIHVDTKKYVEKRKHERRRKERKREHEKRIKIRKEKHEKRMKERKKIEKRRLEQSKEKHRRYRNKK